MSCMSSTCYAKVKGPPLLQNIYVLSLHYMTGHHLHPKGLVHFNVMLGNAQFMPTFTVCRNLKKECNTENSIWKAQFIVHKNKMNYITVCGI